jgi:uncharacterized protein (DUF2147 family)
MKRLSALTAALLSALLITTSSAATNNGDRILGEYRAVKDGRVTTVRFSKSGENRYKAQVVGIRTEKESNSCKDSHNTEINPKQIVIIESVSYNSEEDLWDDGQIYDPINGDIYRVVLDFKDETTLRVRGYLGPFSKSLYWEKIN